MPPSLGFTHYLISRALPVGAMFYLSPTLTLLMLAVVPPVSLGAVRSLSPSMLSYIILITSEGFLWSLPEKIVQQNSGIDGRNDESKRSFSPKSLCIKLIVT